MTRDACARHFLDPEPDPGGSIIDIGKSHLGESISKFGNRGREGSDVLPGLAVDHEHRHALRSERGHWCGAFAETGAGGRAAAVGLSEGAGACACGGSSSEESTFERA